MSESCPAIVQQFSDTVGLGKSLCSFIKDRYDEAVSSKGSFHIAVSGGSLPKFIQGLSKRVDIEWDRWWIYFCDERYVEPDHPDSNYGALKTLLLDHIKVPASQVLQLDSSVSVVDSAALYQSNMRAVLPSMTLDLALCGMGPDGHTCSLFPGHPLLLERELLIAPIMDSPKPPSQRITMTLPLLNKATWIAFVVTGSSKVEQVVASLYSDDPPPAGLVRPTSGNLVWFIDDAAASGLAERAESRAL